MEKIELKTISLLIPAHSLKFLKVREWFQQADTDKAGNFELLFNN